MAPTIEPKDVLQLAVDRADAVNTYWNIFVGVSAAIATFLASGSALASSTRIRVLLSLAFVAFACSNLRAIIVLAGLRNVLLDLLPADVPHRSALVKHLSPADSRTYVAFHLVLDLAIIGIIWLMPR